jgi:hypothetical protein
MRLRTQAQRFMPVRTSKSQSSTTARSCFHEEQTTSTRLSHAPTSNDPRLNPAFAPRTCITDQDDVDSQELMIATFSNDVWPLLHAHQVNCYYPSASHPLFIQRSPRILDGINQTLETTTILDSHQPQSIPTCNSVKQAPVISLDVKQTCFVMQAEYGRAL